MFLVNFMFHYWYDWSVGPLLCPVSLILSLSYTFCHFLFLISFFQSPRSHIVWLFCGFSIVSSPFSEVNFFRNYVPLSNAIAFVSYFLSSILLGSSRCLISQNIGCLIKTPLTIAPKQFFKGVVHEQPWSQIVWLFCGFSIVSRPFSDVNKSKIMFSFPLL